MKVRNGFVTNSSSSSFLVFNVENPELYRFLISMGIELKNTDENCFNDGMEIVLPNGEQLNLYEIDGDWMPTPSEATSISAWLMGIILAEVESLYPPKELDDYSDFTLSIMEQLREKDVVHMEVEDVGEWDRDALFEELQVFDKMDSSIKEAEIELNTGFEGEIINLEYVSAKNGYCLSVSMNEYDDESETPTDIKGLKVAVVGDVHSFDSLEAWQNFLTQHGAVYQSEITEDVDFVICNDFGGEHTEKAHDWCIPVISEDGFLYRFGHKPVPNDEVDIYSELFECTYEGEFYYMFHQYGLGKVIRTKL